VGLFRWALPALALLEEHMSTRTLLDCFPRRLHPRDVQRDVLETLQEHWDRYDIIVLNCPVAAGKSALAEAMARYAGRAAIITPTRILVNQYEKQVGRGVAVLKASDEYFCKCVSTDDHPVTCTCAAKNRASTAGTKRPIHCTDCHRTKAVRAARALPVVVANYYTYIANKLYRPTLIVDEAHQLLPVLRDMAAIRIWEPPGKVRDFVSLVEWLETLVAGRTDKKAWASELLDKLLADGPPKFLIQRGYEDYHHKPRACLSLLPVDVSEFEGAAIFWPKSVSKIVLMSATIGRRDVEAMGLGSKHGRRVLYLEAASPIPKENRPVVFAPVCDMGARHQTPENIEKLAAEIISTATLAPPTARGVVHATYALAAKLRPVIETMLTDMDAVNGGDKLNIDINDFMWHDKESRSTIYNSFIEGQGRILVACGLYEGIDLKGDVASWQILCKVPWPSLGDPAIYWRARHDPEYYAWSTLKTVLQFSGRVCRDPSDYGISYIFDSSFERLMNNWHQLAPNWFKESIQEFPGEQS
jgi:Rad3-related DNA helicase